MFERGFEDVEFYNSKSSSVFLALYLIKLQEIYFKKFVHYLTQIFAIFPTYKAKFHALKILNFP
jgi:hypothetical protein